MKLQQTKGSILIFDRLKNRLAKPRRLISNGRDAFHGSKSFLPELVIGRDHCHYFMVDLSVTPPSDRKQALQSQVELHSPWPECGYAVSWSEGIAQVWVWDSALTSSERFKSCVSFLPETLFYPKPQSDGIRIQSCSHGVELQAWKKGVLHASRWYSQAPEQAQVSWFVRSVAGGVDASMLSPAEPLSTPWEGGRRSLAVWARQRSKQLILLPVFILLLLTSVEITRGLSWQQQGVQWEQQRQTLEQEISPLLSSRSDARQSQGRYSRLLPKAVGVEPLSAQWLVTRQLPAGLDYSVVVWDRSDQRLELVIKAEIAQTLQLVSALQASPIIDSVAVEPWRKEHHHRITMQLTGLPQQYLTESAPSDE